MASGAFHFRLTQVSSRLIKGLSYHRFSDQRRVGSRAAGVRFGLRSAEINPGGPENGRRAHSFHDRPIKKKRGRPRRGGLKS